MSIRWIAGVLLFVSCTAAAESVTFGIEGVVTSVRDQGDHLDGSLSAGTRFAGQYTFDSDQPLSFHSSEPPNGIRIDVGSYRFQSNPERPDFSIQGSAATGRYTVRSLRANESVGPPLDRRIEEISWFLLDPVSDPFTGSGFPITPFALEPWAENVLIIAGCDSNPLKKCNGELQIRGEVTAIYSVPAEAADAEALLGLRVGRHGITFEVVGQGPLCTHEDQFHIELFGEDPVRVLLIRDGPFPGRCHHTRVFRQRLRFSFDELDLALGDRFEVVNPIEVDGLRAPPHR